MAAPDVDACVRALRQAVAAALGLSSLAESGNNVDLSALPSPFAAYQVGDAEVQGPGTDHGHALLDTVTVIPVDVYLARKDVAGAEGLSSIRQDLADLVDAVAPMPSSFLAWPTVPMGLTRIEVAGIGVGAYENYFVGHASGWSSGVASFRMVVVS